MREFEEFRREDSDLENNFDILRDNNGFDILREVYNYPGVNNSDVAITEVNLGRSTCSKKNNKKVANKNLTFLDLKPNKENKRLLEIVKDNHLRNSMYEKNGISLHHNKTYAENLNNTIKSNNDSGKNVSRRSSKKISQKNLEQEKFCYNCYVNSTSIWREVKDRRYCNICYIYYREFKKDRKADYRKQD